MAPAGMTIGIVSGRGGGFFRLREGDGFLGGHCGRLVEVVNVLVRCVGGRGVCQD